MENGEKEVEMGNSQRDAPISFRFFSARVSYEGFPLELPFSRTFLLFHPHYHWPSSGYYRPTSQLAYLYPEDEMDRFLQTPAASEN
jgi:hypothetical protein